MLLKTLMAGITPDPSFEGFATADDMVLAVDVSAGQDADPGDYAVVQAGAKSVTASLNPETKQSAYIRQGKSQLKTGNQRTIDFECDRYIGDEFQDFADAKKYAVGNDAIVNYVYICRLTGLGEKGQATLSLDTDGSGNAEDPLGFSGSLEKSGAAPVPFTWGAAGTTYQVNLNAMGGSIAAGHDVTSYTYGTAVTLPDSTYVTKSSNTFAGWYTDSAYTGDPVTEISATATGDKTFYAKWTPSE